MTGAPGALHALGAADAASRIAAGEIASEALVADCLARIADREPEIGAWAHVDTLRALARARTADAAGSGPLRGIPVGVKDVFDTFDMPTEYGSAIHRGHRPEADSRAVGLLRAAGAVILGKTATTEFASPVPAGVRNPRAPGRSPGVSSSGSAAAVADRMVPAALGTQTGGSVIVPASYCGVFGYKASLDGLDRAGLRHLRPSLDTVGVFARALEDVALVRAALTGRPPATPDPARAAPRIGLCRTPRWHVAEPAAVEALDRAARALRADGARVVDFDLPEGFDEIEDAFRVISSVEGARALAFEAAEHRQALNSWIVETLDFAAGCDAARYDGARAVSEAWRRQLARGFAGIDLLLTPSAPGEATRDLAAVQVSDFNRVWTLMRVPCLNLPAFTGPGGAPVGIQLVAPEGADDRLLADAGWVWPRLAGG